MKLKYISNYLIKNKNTVYSEIKFLIYYIFAISLYAPIDKIINNAYGIYLSFPLMIVFITFVILNFMINTRNLNVRKT